MGYVTRRRLALNTATIDISKSALKLANENDINITQITGTGKGGKITITDVRNYLKSQEEADQGTEEE